MIAYRYNSNGLHIGAIPCQLDPRATKKAGEEVYLLPANSTTVEPPKAKEGYYVIWNGEAWEYVEIPKPPAPPEPTPEEIIEQKIAELDARYNTKKTEYTTSYTAAMMRGDTETAEAIKGYMGTLDDDYDAEYDRIVGEEEE